MLFAGGWQRVASAAAAGFLEASLGDLLPSEREDTGLQSVFTSVFPIQDFRWKLPFSTDLEVRVNDGSHWISNALPLAVWSSGSNWPRTLQ